MEYFELIVPLTGIAAVYLSDLFCIWLLFKSFPYIKHIFTKFAYVNIANFFILMHLLLWFCGIVVAFDTLHRYKFISSNPTFVIDRFSTLYIFVVFIMNTIMSAIILCVLIPYSFYQQNKSIDAQLLKSRTRAVLTKTVFAVLGFFIFIFLYYKILDVL